MRLERRFLSARTVRLSARAVRAGLTPSLVWLGNDLRYRHGAKVLFLLDRMHHQRFRSAGIPNALKTRRVRKVDADFVYTH